MRSLGQTIVVPEGTRSNLASSPRALWIFAAPFELSIYGPLVHDTLYGSGGRITVLAPDGTAQEARFSRLEADRIFYDLMKQEGVWWWRRAAAYRAVRWFGWLRWGKR